jgi:hypothetical protein
MVPVHAPAPFPPLRIRVRKARAGTRRFTPHPVGWPGGVAQAHAGDCAREGRKQVGNGPVAEHHERGKRGPDPEAHEGADHARFDPADAGGEWQHVPRCAFVVADDEHGPHRRVAEGTIGGPQRCQSPRGPWHPGETDRAA